MELPLGRVIEQVSKEKQIDRDVKAIVTEAAEFAQNCPEPDPAELYTDVLVEV